MFCKKYRNAGTNTFADVAIKLCREQSELEVKKMKINLQVIEKSFFVLMVLRNNKNTNN